MKPPVPYVRLARNMYLTENHKHVGTDGQIYLPLLHEWKGGAQQANDNLIELVVAMASVFSNAPPVFTRAEPAPTSGGSAYRPESNSDSDGFPNPHINNNDPELSMSTREANLAIEAAEANAAAEAARAAESVDRQKAADIRRQAEDDRRVREAAAAQEQWEVAQTNRVRQRVVQKIQSHLADKSRQVTLLVQNDYRDQQRLQHATDIKIEQQMTEYEKKKADLEQHCETAEQGLVDIKEYIAQAELLSKEGKPPSADDMVVGSSPLHAQMIDLSCENGAISDTLYFLDRALYQGHLDCLAHQKQVRLLAKQQFLVRAHLIKITQVLQGRNYTKTSNGY
jgi:ESCRT-I complex subunit TSG101